MDVTFRTHRFGDAAADLLVLAADLAWITGEAVAVDRLLGGVFVKELRRQGFGGAEGDVALFQTHGALTAHDVLAVGIGTGILPAPWYRLADVLVARARELKASRVAVCLPAAHHSAAVVERLVEGVYLSRYRFTQLKTSSPSGTEIHSLTLDGTATTEMRAAVRHAQHAAAATCHARDLVNLPAATVTPAYLANAARRIARAQALKLRVLDAGGLRRAGMGALLGVAQGSAQPPRFIELVYRPRRRARTRVALAGKGITFDSGGLSIKPAEAMQAQKRDMAGAAAVLAVMSVVRDLDVGAEVRAYVPATENMPGGRALKPGDVVRAHNGKSIEVLNTDAEGRLVLADALSYAAAAKPDVLIDLATLTAAVRTALGTRYAAIMGSDPALVQALTAAARACGEHLWELPLVEEYRADLDSTVADLKNIGEGGAGTIVAALFLREFTAGVPWAHIDFSSTVMTDKPLPCHPRGATGFGVRTLLEYLRHL
jgi:leucyl aminopeptidase